MSTTSRPIASFLAWFEHGAKRHLSKTGRGVGKWRIGHPWPLRPSRGSTDLTEHDPEQALMSAPDRRWPGSDARPSKLRRAGRESRNGRGRRSAAASRGLAPARFFRSRRRRRRRALRSRAASRHDVSADGDGDLDADARSAEAGTIPGSFVGGCLRARRRSNLRRETPPFLHRRCSSARPTSARPSLEKTFEKRAKGLLTPVNPR
mgnify:CR=1 FL=1